MLAAAFIHVSFACSSSSPVIRGRLLGGGHYNRNLKKVRPRISCTYVNARSTHIRVYTTRGHPGGLRAGRVSAAFEPPRQAGVALRDAVVLDGDRDGAAVA